MTSDSIGYYTGSIEETHAAAREDVLALGEFGAWIGSESRSADSGEEFATLDPVVGEEICSVPQCTATDVDAAVKAAQEAFDGGWGACSPQERSNAMLSWVATLRENVGDLALVESLDGGKPLKHALVETKYALDFLEYYAKVVQADEGITVPTDDDMHVYTRHEPHGVVGLITPWNFPLTISFWKLGPALAAGNAAVIKPAEQTPLSMLYAAELSKDILPDGTLNVVTGFGEEAGAPLTEHAAVGKVSFTGEDVTGKTVMKAAAETVTAVTLELGGKSPYVVFPSADVKKAVRDVAHGIFYNAGQSCDACSRVLVHEDIAEEFTEGLVARAEGLTPGDTLVEGTTVGPLISADQFEKVTDYVEIGREEGATCVTGGAVEDGDLTDGWYVRPTVLTDVDNDMRVAQEEIFGPVEVITTFETYDEAIELANDVEFGLAAGVATENTTLAHRAAADIEAGSVWINGNYATPIPGGPFGGYKQSGIGRECSRDALRHFTQEKAVHVALDEPSL
ncbi:aldehyde dehydrogenase family protein [Natrinema gelatinilyticum]|uniref:aldehyde dehydrogenase family protein n=1 Tax=Natrinema gelatinilyticum TaxID=2961571 RepID=UPI0020C4066C|nr:aldehyde dehydrogenase family protein [Natrinema gelatinilyticum]